MDKLVSIRIDLDKVDNNRVFQGAKGRYLDIVGVLTELPDQYQNNGFVTQQVTKEERQQGVKMPVLGNFKKLADLQPKGFAPNAPAVPQAPKAPATPVGVQTPAPAPIGGDDDLPF